MANPIITGAILIEANGAALNMAGQEQGTRTDNAIVVKQIKIGRNRYPYVSGQAWRRWLREVLYEDYGWKRSPITRDPKSAYTEGDPIEYEEDDIFGYMAAKKRGQQGGTQRRVSPLKNSLLISVLPNTISNDFGHFSRNLHPEQDIIPFEHQHYTAPLQGVFTLSLGDVSRFEIGEMRDLSKDTLQKHMGALVQTPDGSYRLKDQRERSRRVSEVLKALAVLRHGAQLARNLSDVSPVAVVLGFLDGGNAPLQNIFQATIEGDRVQLNLERFKSVLLDYADRILQVNTGEEVEQMPMLIGLRPTVLANEDEVHGLAKEEPFAKLIKLCSSPLSLIHI